MIVFSQVMCMYISLGITTSVCEAVLVSKTFSEELIVTLSPVLLPNK